MRMRSYPVRLGFSVYILCVCACLCVRVCACVRECACVCEQRRLSRDCADVQALLNLHLLYKSNKAAKNKNLPHGLLAKAQTSLCIYPVSPGPSLLAQNVLIAYVVNVNAQ